MFFLSLSLVVIGFCYGGFVLCFSSFDGFGMSLSCFDSSSFFFSTLGSGDFSLGSFLCGGMCSNFLNVCSL
jgi:hypothetical protein